MISLCYVSTNMMSKYVLTGLTVAQEMGGISVTVQKPGPYSAEKAVLFHASNSSNLCVIETECVSVEEHEQRLRLGISEVRDD